MPANRVEAEFLVALRARVLHARASAVRALNRELVLLCWDIGHGIVDKQLSAGWGDAVVERLAADLRAAFPDMSGFSVVNVWRMRRLYPVHAAPDFLSQAVIVMKGDSARPEKLSQAVRDLVAFFP